MSLKNKGVVMSKKVIAYKGLDKDFKCRGMQYAVGKEYEMDGKVALCSRGYHACENPFDVLNYYAFLDSRFAVVELSGEVKKGNDKSVASKIKLTIELSPSEFVQKCVDWVIVATKGKGAKADINSAQIGSSGYSAQIGSSGDYAQIGSSGNSAQIGSSGYYAKIGSSGNYAQIGSSGNSAQIGSSGYYAQIGSSGDSAQIGSSGYYAKIGSSGYYAKIGSSGYYAKIGSSGNYAQIGSSGYYAKIGSSGNYAQIDSNGQDAVVSAIGAGSMAKAEKGSWIVLAEYDENGKPIHVKSRKVDGKRLKAGVYYRLKDKKFVEA